MAKNTALGAEKSKKRNITFKNKEHEKFYHTYLPNVGIRTHTIKHWFTAWDCQKIPDEM